MKYLLVLLLLVQVNSVTIIDAIKNSLSFTLLASSCIEIYTRIPSTILYNSTPKPINFTSSSSSSSSSSSNVCIIFPGYGGPDKNTDDLLLNIQKYNKKNGIKCYVTVYDWRKWCGNLLRAANDAMSVGKILGDDIVLKNANLKNAHIIGVSVGSFAADTLAKIIKKKTSSYVRLTLLDPFCSRGIFFQKYGNTNFGKDVDFAEQYLNSDDPVPFTNKPCHNCYCYDVTFTKDKKYFKPLPNDNTHSWPVAYYAKNCIKSLNLKLNHEILKRGDVNILE